MLRLAHAPQLEAQWHDSMVSTCKHAVLLDVWQARLHRSIVKKKSNKSQKQHVKCQEEACRLGCVALSTPSHSGFDQLGPSWT